MSVLPTVEAARPCTVKVPGGETVRCITQCRARSAAAHALLKLRGGICEGGPLCSAKTRDSQSALVAPGLVTWALQPHITDKSKAT